MLINIAADIPASLRDADQTLTQYGRWAMWRNHRQTCGSAEGAYKSPPNDDDRTPRELIMLLPDAMAAQRALAQVPEINRVVLAVLYIPNRIPAVVQMRKLHIPPRLSQERHLSGLFMFRNILDRIRESGYRIRAPETDSARPLA